MFTKEKLEKWIEILDEWIETQSYILRNTADTDPYYEELSSKRYNLSDLRYTLEQIYTSITRDGSI